MLNCQVDEFLYLLSLILLTNALFPLLLKDFLSLSSLISHLLLPPLFALLLESTEYGPCLQHNDLVCVYLNMDACTVAFSVNGVRFPSFDFPRGPVMYPAFSLSSPGDTLELVPFDGNCVQFPASFMQETDGSDCIKSRPGILLKIPYVKEAQQWNLVRAHVKQ